MQVISKQLQQPIPMCDLEISMYESGRVKNPAIICSGVMGPCISIGIYDTKNKNGYMRHQPNCNHDQDMENFIIETLIEVEKINAKVFICGGSYSKYDGNSVLKNTRDSRKHMKLLVGKYFDKKQVTTKWSKPDYRSELILETSTGKFSVEKFPIEYSD